MCSLILDVSDGFRPPSGECYARFAAVMRAWRYEDAARIVHSYRCDMPEVNFNRGVKAAACVLKASGDSPDDALAND